MMDSLHGMLRTLSSDARKTKQANTPVPEHLTVFREFLSHLDRAQRQPSPRPRMKPLMRKAARAGKR